MLLKVGYAGGDIENPSYQDVCTGATKHNEVVRVRLPKIVKALHPVMLLGQDSSGVQGQPVVIPLFPKHT